MDVVFDPAKNTMNIHKHGISLQRAEDLDFEVADFAVDDREDYGEVRWRAISFLDGNLYSLTFTQAGDTIRAISLRKATRQEHRDYAAIR